jgi:hypothetical protein
MRVRSNVILQRVLQTKRLYKLYSIYKELGDEHIGYFVKYAN